MKTIEDIYGFEVSEGMVSDITDKLLPKIEEWQNRPLSAVYPIVSEICRVVIPFAYIEMILSSIKEMSF